MLPAGSGPAAGMLASVAGEAWGACFPLLPPPALGPAAAAGLPAGAASGFVVVAAGVAPAAAFFCPPDGAAPRGG